MSLEIVRASGSAAPSPGVRVQPTVTKLVDTSTCIGCKACEVACQEWNDLPPEATTQSGTYQTMPATTANFWNLIKFNEHEDEGGALQWLMRKDQCMHCAEPGCLVACPAPERDRPVLERHRRLPAGPLHRVRILHHRLSVRCAEVQCRPRAGSTSARSVSIAWRSVCSRRA